MAETPPIRPQRGVAGSGSRTSNRESTGGLLMQVIRTLSSSRDLADRDREKANLEKGFAQCDQKLNELVNLHNNDLYTVMNIFSKILTNLGRSKEKLLDTREKLQNCQKLLHCKRDELKKLWLESVENKALFDLLERVETVASLPKQVDSLASRKFYLCAAECVVSGLKQLGEESQSGPQIGSSNSTTKNSRFEENGYGVLSKIDALAEVRVELLAKKESLFESAIDELHRHLYLISSADVRKSFHRNGSFRSSGNYLADRLTVTEQRSRRGSTAELLANNADLKKLLQKNQSIDQSKDSNESDSLLANSFLIDGNTNNFDNYPEEDSRHFISMLTKCIGLLNKIPEAIEMIKDRSDREFINVVIKTAQDVLVSSGGTNSAASTVDSNSVPATRANSFLDISSMGSDSLNGNMMPALNNQATTGSNQTVLTCTSLLGHTYNGYSHLSESNRKVNINEGSLQLNKSSLQLQDFFDMLMRQYQTIVSLHENIVLRKLEQIESGLHSTDLNNDPNSYKTVFYTSAELWSRIQSLVQQLLDYFLDSSNSIQPTGSLHFLLNSSSSNVVGGTGNTATSNSSLPTDYSSFFSKRRALAGAMNAVNVMTKNTMTAVVSSATGGSSSSSNQNESNTVQNLSSTLSPGSTLNSNSIQPQTLTSGGNFLSFGSSGRANNLSLFKFDQSSQAISWNTFMQEQNQLNQQSLLSSKPEEKNKDADGRKDKEDADSSALSVSSVTPSVIRKLFETLRSISAPSPDNLVIIYGTLMKFAQQCPPFADLNDQSDSYSVKSLSSRTSRTVENTLHAYLVTAAEKFLAHVNVQLEKMLEMASKSLESGTTISIAHMSPLTAAITLEENEILLKDQGKVSKAQLNQQHFMQQQLNSKLYPPLLESAVLVDVSIRDLRTLMQAIPEYCNDFLGYILNVLNNFKGACSSTYDTIVEPSSSTNGLSSSASTYDISSSHSHHNLAGEKRIISATWAKDQDINRLLKSLPNWGTLQVHQTESGEVSMQTTIHLPSITKVSPVDGRKRFNHQISSFDESPEEIRLRNLREIEILTRNLSKNISKHGLLWQDGQFKQLGQLQESIEWMAARCDDLVNSIIALQQKTDNPNYEQFKNLQEVYIATLNQQSKDFADLAELCLLVMHLEVRIHCFYHLQSLDYNFFTTAAPPLEPEVQASRSRQEHFSDDPKIIMLLDDLKRMYDELQQASLKSYKMMYVFEGLDHLITTIFINAVSQVNRIKPNGVKRACRAIYDIQRRLSSITKSRELALDYARQYFEMLLTTPGEILSNLIDGRLQFQSQEYITAVTLLYESSSTGETHITKKEKEAYLQKLQDILNGAPVTI